MRTHACRWRPLTLKGIVPLPARVLGRLSSIAGCSKLRNHEDQELSRAVRDSHALVGLSEHLHQGGCVEDIVAPPLGS